MQNAEKVEIGYTLPKERWQEAAKNLEDLGNALAASLRAHNKDGRGVEDVKSKATRTAKYAMKKKMLKDRFGYDITEV